MLRTRYLTIEACARKRACRRPGSGLAKIWTACLRLLLVASLLVALLAAAMLPLEFIHYTDVATASGLTVSNTFGGRTQKDYILETTGNGAAIFDYDGDGLNDIFIANGTTFKPPKEGPARTPQLYHNDGKGHFTDVAAQAGFTTEGWGQGVCIGDYENHGHPELLFTYYGHNILYRNLGNGNFEAVTKKAGLPVSGTRYGSGCTFLDYDRDGHLDLFIANYVQRPGSRQNS